MNIEMLNCLKNEIEDLSKEYQVQSDRLNNIRQYAGKVLLESRRGGYSFYYERERDFGSNRKYIGSENNEAVIKIKEARYLTLSLKLLEENINALESLIKNYHPYDVESISNMLPKAYRSKKAMSLRLDNTPSGSVEKWLEKNRMLKIEREQIVPDKYKDSKRIERANGETMRSKSEVMIADLLDKYGIPYIYELPHYCNGKWIRTDFTVLSKKDYKTEILIEHLGMMDTPSYRNLIGNKIADYMIEGYKPNINLFFTFDNIDKSFSMMPLKNIINTWLI